MPHPMNGKALVREAWDLARISGRTRLGAWTATDGSLSVEPRSSGSTRPKVPTTTSTILRRRCIVGSCPSDRIGVGRRLHPRCGVRHRSVRRDGDRVGSWLPGCGPVGGDAQRGAGEVAEARFDRVGLQELPLRRLIRRDHVHRRNGERPSRGVAGGRVRLRSGASP